MGCFQKFVRHRYGELDSGLIVSIRTVSSFSDTSVLPGYDHFDFHLGPVGFDHYDFDHFDFGQVEYL